MTTLTKSSFSAITTKLFDDAAASDMRLKQQMQGTRSGGSGASITLTEDYRALYGSLKDFHLAVSRETAKLLYMLVRSSRARTIVEFGTSFGVSTLHLAAALRDNGGGRVISTEFEPTKVARARANLSAAGLDDLVEIRVGDALETLARDLPEEIDLVLLDGAKNLYPKILSLLEPRLRSGSLVLADNADWSPDYLARIRDAAGGYVSVPFSNEVELTMRL
jgi:predicted O-methyltransferase YrrM